MEAGISDEDYMKINDSNSNTGELERPDTPIVDNHRTRGEYPPILLDGKEVEEQAPSNGSDPGREDAVIF
ncbi:hypothetical protein JR316_0008584 [Psilocybe cubensis]|uniref:Uncharacterized protein n=1 Tax=Psilocybe cubensis TaxID=181762 RepID=A0ACB8GR35_PSICU|nr:hypothetical protein JR316_0008584 [Psilocybe cubensis]KAH9478131.1 hypothetical protein JR316_0008584 [Psilocybe cubensis]